MMTRDRRCSHNSLTIGRSDLSSLDIRFHVKFGYDSGTGEVIPGLLWRTSSNKNIPLQSGSEGAPNYTGDQAAPGEASSLTPGHVTSSVLLTRTGDDISNVLGLIARVAIDDRRKWKFDGEALLGSLSQLPLHSLLSLTLQLKENGEGHLLSTRPPGYRT